MNRTAVKFTKTSNFIKAACITLSMLAGTVGAHSAEDPIVSITPSNSPIPSRLADTAYATEGDPVGFILQTASWLAREITVNVRVEDSGGYLQENYHQEVIPIELKPFGGMQGKDRYYSYYGKLEKIVDFFTKMDNVPEEDNLITFTLLEGEGYEVDESQNVAKTFVRDNDNNFAPGESVDVSFVVSPDNETVRAREKVAIYATSSKDALLGIRITIRKQSGEEKVYNRKRRVSRIIGNNLITEWAPAFWASYLQSDNTYYHFSSYNDESFTIKVTSINGTEIDGEELVLKVGELPRTIEAGQENEIEAEPIALVPESEGAKEISEDNPVVFPAISVSAVSDVVTEGEEVRFVFSAAPAPSERLEVSTQIVKEGNFFEPDIEEMSVFFEPDETETTLPYNTVNDDLDESNGSVTVTVLEVEDSYVVGENSSVRIAILDDDYEVEEEIVDATSEDDSSEKSEETVAGASLTGDSEKEANDNPETELPTFSVFATSETIEPGEAPAFYIVTDKLEFRDVIFQVSYDLDNGETVVLRFYDGDVPEDFALKLSQFPGKYVSKESLNYLLNSEAGRIQKYHLEIVDREYYSVDQSAKKATVTVDFPDAEEVEDSGTDVTKSSTTLPEIKISSDSESVEPLQIGEYVKVNFAASAKPAGPVYVRYSFANADEEIFADKAKLSPDAFVQMSNHGYGAFHAEFSWSPEEDVKKLLRKQNPFGKYSVKVELLEDSNDPSRHSYTIAEKNTFTIGVLPPPIITITAKSKVITEGSNAVFVLTANRRDHKGFNVKIVMSHSGDFMAEPNVKVVRFDAASVEETFKIHTSSGKSGDKTQFIQVFVMDGQGYMPSEKNWSAGLEVTEKKKISSSAKVQNDGAKPEPVIPMVTVRAERNEITEGEDAVFLIESDFPEHNGLKVNLAVKSTGDYLSNPLPKKLSVKIRAGKTLGRLVLPTDNDNKDEANDGIIRIDILSGKGYAVHKDSTNKGKARAISAKVVVLDNDTKLSAKKYRNAKLHRRMMPNIIKSSMNRARDAFGRRFGMAFSDLEGSHSIQVSNSDSLTSAIENGGHLINRDGIRLKDILHDSSFAFRISPDVYGQSATVWGNGLNSDEYGRDDQIVWNGNLYASHFGVDTRFGNNLLIGATTISTESSMDFEHEDEAGIYNVDMNTFQPYMAWSDGDTQLNGFAGYGFGEIEVIHMDSEESQYVESKLYSASVNGLSSLYGYQNDFGTGEFSAEGKAWAAMQSIQGFDNIVTQGYDVWLNGVNAKSFDNGISVETSALIGLEERMFNLEALWDFHFDSVLLSPNYNAEWNETGLIEHRIGSRVSIGRDANTEFGIVYDKEGNRKFDINGRIQW